MFSRKKKDDASVVTSSSTATTQSNTLSLRQTNGGTITESRSFSSTITSSSSSRRHTSHEVIVSGTLSGTSSLPRSIWDNNARIPASSTSGALSYNYSPLSIGSPTSPTLRTDAKPFTPTTFSSVAPRIIGYNPTPPTAGARVSTSSYTPSRALGSSSTTTSSFARPFNRELQTYHSYSSPSKAKEVVESFPSTVSLPSAGEKNYDPRIPTYDTNDKKNEERDGAVTDELDLVKLFSKFGFDVKTERNLKSSDMKTRIKKFRSDSSLKSFDMSIVIIMSHGNNFDKQGNRVKGGYTEIYGTDNNGVHIDDVLNEFSSEVCSFLSGKPKIFIFQCCRGDNEEKIATDAAPIKTAIKNHADMLLAFSTLPGFSSNRDPKKGTWYIQSMIKVFEQHAKAYDIEQLLKMVDRELSNLHPTYKQTSTYECRGFKRCYLNPK